MNKFKSCAHMNDVIASIPLCFFPKEGRRLVHEDGGVTIFSPVTYTFEKDVNGKITLIKGFNAVTGEYI